jgi:hypothetical protein
MTVFSKDTLWQWLYPQWRTPVAKLIPGYSILMLVPADLPFFLKIALEVCATQNPEHLVETLIIPDQSIQGFSEILETYAKDYPISPIRLIQPKRLDYLITRFQNNPHNNCWLQMVRGVEALRTTHGLWHDVDLFITQPNFMKTHYETCSRADLACLGVSKAWDRSFDELGINHLTATWEMMFNLNWVRSFRPWEHRGHDEIIDGKSHLFDISYWPQYRTPAEKIGRHEQELGFIHFNYVTGTYRRFQRSKGPHEDDAFRLLLVRLLIDAYDQSGWVYEIPSVDNLAKGITDESNRITYLQETTRERYPEFRSKLQELLESGVLGDARASIMEEGVRPFDRAFGWTNNTMKGLTFSSQRAN